MQGVLKPNRGRGVCSASSHTISRSYPTMLPVMNVIHHPVVPPSLHSVSQGVLEPYRRRGIASLLLQQVINAARQSRWVG